MRRWYCCSSLTESLDFYTKVKLMTNKIRTFNFLYLDLKKNIICSEWIIIKLINISKNLMEKQDWYMWVNKVYVTSLIKVSQIQCKYEQYYRMGILSLELYYDSTFGGLFFGLGFFVFFFFSTKNFA